MRVVGSPSIVVGAATPGRGGAGAVHSRRNDLLASKPSPRAGPGTPAGRVGVDRARCRSSPARGCRRPGRRRAAARWGRPGGRSVAIDTTVGSSTRVPRGPQLLTTAQDGSSRATGAAVGGGSGPGQASAVAAATASARAAPRHGPRVRRVGCRGCALRRRGRPGRRPGRRRRPARACRRRRPAATTRPRARRGRGRRRGPRPAGGRGRPARRVTWRGRCGTAVATTRGPLVPPVPHRQRGAGGRGARGEHGRQGGPGAAVGSRLGDLRAESAVRGRRRSARRERTRSGTAARAAARGGAARRWSPPSVGPARPARMPWPGPRDRVARRDRRDRVQLVPARGHELRRSPPAHGHPSVSP